MLQLLCSNKMEKNTLSHTHTQKTNHVKYCAILSNNTTTTGNFYAQHNLWLAFTSTTETGNTIAFPLSWEKWLGQTTAMLQHTMASVSVVHWAYEGKKCRKNPTQRWKWKFCCKFRPKESLSANIADSSGFRYSNTAKLLQRWVQVGTTISFCLSVFCLFFLVSRLCRTQRNLNIKQCR